MMLVAGAGPSLTGAAAADVAVVVQLGWPVRGASGAASALLEHSLAATVAQQ